MENETRKIRARARGGIGRLGAVNSANFDQDTHGAGLIAAYTPEIKERTALPQSHGRQRRDLLRP